MPTNQNKHAFLRVDREIITLPINPEEFNVTDPARVAVTFTLGGCYVDHWGAGFGELTIAGTTGWGQAGRPDGVVVYHTLLRAWKQYMGRKGRCRFEVHLPHLSRAWLVTPRQLQSEQSATNPLMIRYRWPMFILADLTHALPKLDLTNYQDPQWQAVRFMLRNLPGEIRDGQAFLYYDWPEGGSTRDLQAWCSAVGVGAVDIAAVARINRIRTYRGLPAGFRLRIPYAPGYVVPPPPLLVGTAGVDGRIGGGMGIAGRIYGTIGGFTGGAGLDGRIGGSMGRYQGGAGLDGRIYGTIGSVPTSPLAGPGWGIEGRMQGTMG